MVGAGGCWRSAADVPGVSRAWGWCRLRWGSWRLGAVGPCGRRGAPGLGAVRLSARLLGDGPEHGEAGEVHGGGEQGEVG